MFNVEIFSCCSLAVAVFVVVAVIKFDVEEVLVGVIVVAAAAAAVVVVVVVVDDTEPVGGVGKSKARFRVASLSASCFSSALLLSPPPPPPVLLATIGDDVLLVVFRACVAVAVRVVMCACIVSCTTFDDKIDSRIGCSSQ